MKQLEFPLCWWEYKIVQSLWEFLIKLTIYLHYDPAIPSQEK